ncbi:MAG TPA: 3-hydroxy-3-methylglutaryl-CoA reductase, partial [Minicystis sp.]|nr:3-hydroxy-3-methylglutaryl-CoA reductase [Minicystis sp.]
MTEFSSRISGLYKLLPEARRAVLEGLGVVDRDAARQLASGGLPLAVADAMSENVVSTHGLPLGVAVNFRVNGRDVLVPMAVEEPSIVA